jgi:APA family basic amino acid/polyamine antiporter
MNKPGDPDPLFTYIGVRSATGLVVASMIGAGIFTTTGFQAADLGHPGIIYGLWLLGGLLAWCGALCFAELGAAMPKAGGEYIYIRETYGQLWAFVGAVLSLTAGFSAPIAAVLKSMSVYLGNFFPVLQDNPELFLGLNAQNALAILVTWIMVAIHSSGVRGGLGFNDLITFAKVAGIVVVILAAFLIGKGQWSQVFQVSPVYETLSRSDLSARMATSLIFVSFCYLGWNGSAYVASEMKDPQRALPYSLLLGTGLVTVLYVGLNVVFFYASGAEGLAGELEVGTIAGEALFGSGGNTAVISLVVLCILGSASSMTITGGRIYYAFGQDFPPLKVFSKVSPKTGAPWPALVLQGVATSLFILSGRVDQILQYCGFSLTVYTSIAVAAVIVLRIKHPDMERPFKTWGYPFTPLFYLAVSLWTIVWAVRGRPVESLAAFATVLAAGLIFYVIRQKETN